MIKSWTSKTLVSILLMGVLLQPTAIEASISYDYPSVNILISNPFITRWNTSLVSAGSSNSTQITLPLISSGTYSFYVDWGDGSTNLITTWNQAEVTHTYATEGVYTLIIDGIIDGWSFNYGGDKLKIIELSQWGNDIRLGDLGSYFSGCANMRLTATDAPDLTGTTNLSSMFNGASSLGSNGTLDNWDVSGVTNMDSMFYQASSFNQSIGNWNTSSVRFMGSMFFQASEFNQPLGNWDVSSVTDISDMFYLASSFNQDISNWNVSKVVDGGNLFFSASSFNQPLGNWNTSGILLMGNMFYKASKFNQPLGNWDVSSATDMTGMFGHASSFNQDLSSWDVSSVTDMTGMFGLASSFNQSIGNWNISSVVDLKFMFDRAAAFNQDISNWDVSSATDMSWLFNEASSFNQDLSSWNVSSVTNMVSMFAKASSFDQDIGNWNVSRVTDMTYMFADVSLSTMNYDALLSGWSGLSLQSGVFFDGGRSRYSNITARQHIIDTFGWTIIDGGLLDTTPPYISSPADISYDLGSTGNNIVWIIGDTNLLRYNITLDGGPYLAKTSLVNATLTLPIDGLTAGIHDFTIYVYDDQDNMASDTVSITVIDNTDVTVPTIDSPADISYKEGSTGNGIVWTAGDKNPTTYTVTKDGSLYISPTPWSNGTIIVNIDGLSKGTYSFVIQVFDSEGNMVSDTVKVAVTGDTSTDNPSSSADASVSLVFLISIPALIIIRRKRERTSVL